MSERISRRASLKVGALALSGLACEVLGVPLRSPIGKEVTTASTGTPRVDPIMTPSSTIEASAQPTVIEASSQPTLEFDWLKATYDQAGGIPYNGKEWNTDVAPDEIEVFTGGPASINGVELSGGAERGSVVILLPDPYKQEVTHYTVKNVIPGSNWHGSFRPLADPSLETTWKLLAEDRVKAMQVAPNCTDGNGCGVVDVLVVSGERVVKQWTVGE